MATQAGIKEKYALDSARYEYPAFLLQDPLQFHTMWRCAAYPLILILSAAVPYHVDHVNIVETIVNHYLAFFPVWYLCIGHPLLAGLSFSFDICCLSFTISMLLEYASTRYIHSSRRLGLPYLLRWCSSAPHERRFVYTDHRRYLVSKQLPSLILNRKLTMTGEEGWPASQRRYGILSSPTGS